MTSTGLAFRHALMAHRGGSLEWVENTMPAFRYSAKTLKVDLLELDCYETKDGKVVIFHDQDLERLCGVKGKTIADYNYEELPPLLIRPELQNKPEVVKDPDSKKIPLLEDLLDEFPTYPMQIDIKRGASSLVDKVGNLILSHKRQARTVWGSFHEPQNTWCRTNFPTIPHFFTARRMALAFLSWSVGLLRFMTIHESAMIMPSFKWIMWPGFAQAINKRGVPIIVFGMPGGGVNTVEGWKAVQKFGANGICSDLPTPLKEWLRTNPLKGVNDWRKTEH
ncbi:Lysophospholipase D gdpd1 [Gaertneriomyces sp. JEL0708]|nr:Lysophospholipase D gdpd1 [Gaertneriomyces sp. JEL0708]